jgi:hypothetical protein
MTTRITSDNISLGNAALILPVGTSLQRPANPTSGMIRFNSTTCVVEVYDSNSWVVVGSQAVQYTVQYLIVGGGGSGGYDRAGGGGAGGYLNGNTCLNLGSVYSITIGAGGSAMTGYSQSSTNCGNHSCLGSSLIGYGGGYGSYAPGSGAPGGSGGGASSYVGSGGTACSGQGNPGGASVINPSGSGAAGGGGACETGYNGQTGTGCAGRGGNGCVWVNGSTYSGGGGGGAAMDFPLPRQGGCGGSGGGGPGGNSNGAPGTAGSTNTGGGGGGGANIPQGNGAAGGSGIVILRYLGPQCGCGGSVTSSGGFTYHTFTSSGTYTA